MAVTLISEQQARQQFDADTLVVRPKYLRTWWQFAIQIAMIAGSGLIAWEAYWYIGTPDHLNSSRPLNPFIYISLAGLICLVLIYNVLARILFLYRNRGLSNWVLAVANDKLWVNFLPMRHGWSHAFKISLAAQITDESLGSFGIIKKTSNVRLLGYTVSEDSQEKASYIEVPITNNLHEGDRRIIEHELDFQHQECLNKTYKTALPYLELKGNSLLIKWRLELSPPMPIVLKRLIEFRDKNVR